MSHHEQVQPGDNSPQAGPGTEATRRDVVELWTGILTGPVLWFAQQQICFVLVPWVCTHGGVIWLHLVTLVCLLERVARDCWRYRFDGVSNTSMTSHPGSSGCTSWRRWVCSAACFFPR